MASMPKFEYRGLTVVVPDEVLEESGLTIEEFEKMLHEENVDFSDGRPLDAEELDDLNRELDIKDAKRTLQ
jgi:hypothetical protein